MKKLMPLPLLLLCPLLAQADPQFGPAFERAVLLAIVLYLFVFPLLIAQVVSWTLTRISSKENNRWVIRAAAILASWFGVYCVFIRMIKLHGDGLINTKGGIYLAIFSFVGASLVAPLATKW